MIRRLIALCVVGASSVMVAPGAAHAAKPSGAITVSAASSLTEAFPAVAKAFEKANPGTSVTFNFGASSALEQQITAGAPADVFASAAAIAPTIGTGRVFARNRLTIVVEKGNPRHIKKLNDLAHPDTIVVLCASQVPCGKYADAVFGRAHVDVVPASREENVKGVLTKVELGEADAGIVYVTDVKAAATRVSGVAIPGKENAIANYPLVVLESSKNPVTAKAFAKFVTSPAGQKILRRYGFLSP